MAGDKNKGGRTKEEIEAGEDGEPMYVTLEYDDGTVVESEVMGIFDMGGKEYIALIPDDGSDDVYLYGYKDVGEDDFELLDIEDDAEFEAAVNAFDAIMAEQE